MYVVFSFKESVPRISVVAEFDANPAREQPADVETETVKIDLPEKQQSPVEMEFNDIAKQDEIANDPASYRMIHHVLRFLSREPNTEER